MGKLRAILDVIGGWLVGATMAWSLTALTSFHAAFGPSWYPDDFGPVRGLVSLKKIVIDHNTVACWLLLSAATLASMLLLLRLCRPLYRFRFFIAAFTGALMAVLIFVCQASNTLFVGMPGRIWMPAAQMGSPAWEALRHHQNSFWTLADEFIFLKMLDMVLENLSTYMLAVALPLVWAVLYRTEPATATETSSSSARMLTGPTVKMLIASTIISLSAYTVTGGIGPPDPEPKFKEVDVFRASTKIEKGTVIQEWQIEEDPFEYVPLELSEFFVDGEKNPVGKTAKSDIPDGWTIKSHDVENGEPVVDDSYKKGLTFYGAWQTATEQVAAREPAKTVRAAKATRNISEGSIIKSEDVTLVSIPEGSIDGNLPKHPDIVVGATSGRIRRNQILVYTAGSSYQDYHGIPYLYLFADFLPDPVPEQVR